MVELFMFYYHHICIYTKHWLGTEIKYTNTQTIYYRDTQNTKIYICKLYAGIIVHFNVYKMNGGK